MDYRSYPQFGLQDMDLWNILATVTFNATFHLTGDEEHAQLCRLEDELEEELRAIREAPAPRPIGVKPHAEEEDDEATATDDRDVDDEEDVDDDDDEYEDDLDDDDVDDDDDDES